MWGQWSLQENEMSRMTSWAFCLEVLPRRWGRGGHLGRAERLSALQAKGLERGENEVVMDVYARAQERKELGKKKKKWGVISKNLHRNFLESLATRQDMYAEGESLQGWAKQRPEKERQAVKSICWEAISWTTLSAHRGLGDGQHPTRQSAEPPWNTCTHSQWLLRVAKLGERIN